MYVHLRNHLTTVLKELAHQRESEIEEGHLRPDHVHIMISVPPKYSVSQVVGYLKGKRILSGINFGQEVFTFQPLERMKWQCVNI